MNKEAIKRQPAFKPTTEDFYIKWDSILYDAERKLVELLLVESKKVVGKIEIDINNQLIEEYSTEASEKRELERRNQKYIGNHNSAEGTNDKNLRENIKKVIDQGY